MLMDALQVSVLHNVVHLLHGFAMARSTGGARPACAGAEPSTWCCGSMVGPSRLGPTVRLRKCALHSGPSRRIPGDADRSGRQDRFRGAGNTGTMSRDIISIRTSPLEHEGTVRRLQQRGEPASRSGSTTMCGIAGEIAFRAARAGLVTVGRVTEAGAGRGRDGQGRWSCAWAVVDHRRSAVIDPSEPAARPMVDGAGPGPPRRTRPRPGP